MFQNAGEGYVPLAGVGPRAVWAAKVTGLAFWAVVAGLAAAGTTVAVAWVSYWFQTGYSHDVRTILVGCASISCLGNKSVCIDLVRDSPPSCGDVLVNATLNCTAEAYPVIVECATRQKNTAETGNAWLYISVMNQVVLTGFLIFGAFGIVAQLLWTKSREVWTAGPSDLQVPAADAPPDADEGEVLAPAA
jgi:hypothetical protein